MTKRNGHTAPKLPFTSLHVTRFRGLRDLALDDLGPVNILFGQNDSGKTSLLEALALMCDPEEWGNWWNVGGIRYGGFAIPSRLCWLFARDPEQDPSAPFSGRMKVGSAGNSGDLSIDARVQEVTRVMPIPVYVAGGENRVEDRTDIGAQLAIQLERGSRIEHSFWTYESRVIKGQNRWRVLLPYHRGSHNSDARLFSAQRVAGETGDLLTILRALDDRIRGLEVLAPKGEPVLYLRTEENRPIPLSEFGDGVRRAVALALNVTGLENGVLLIDEVETATHVSAIPKVFQWLVETCSKMNIQLFVTTHSLEAIDGILAAVEKSPTNVVGYHLDRPREGGAVKRYQGDVLRRLRFERGLDLR